MPNRLLSCKRAYSQDYNRDSKSPEAENPFSLLTPWILLLGLKRIPRLFIIHSGILRLDLAILKGNKMSSTVQGGYPVRRENSCGQFPGFKTWDNWYSCCPEGLSEPEQYGANSQCPDTNTGTGVVPAQCANSTWTLWWAKGYFCCEPQLTGFTNGRYWYGCATKTAINKNNTWTSATQTGTCSSMLSSRLFF